MPTKHKPTAVSRTRVLTLATGLGSRVITQEAIAEDLGICVETLVKYYASELKRGKLELYSKAVEAAELLIADGNPQVVLTILKGIGGIGEVQKHEFNTQSGSVMLGINAPAPPLSLEEWKKEAVDYKNSL